MDDKRRQLIIDAITHWEKDAVGMFDEYVFVKHRYTWRHKKTGSEIVYRLRSKYCTLCLDCNAFCSYCMWFKYSGKICNAPNQEYYNFMSYPSKENALKVIEKLWRIGTNA